MQALLDYKVTPIICVGFGTTVKEDTLEVIDVVGAQVAAALEDVDPRSVMGGGDVKYHVGATGQIPTRNGGTINMHLVSNPRHLEAVDPVAMGRARARQTRVGEDGEARVLPVLIHGDAAFAGQGIWAETLNFAGLKGYSVGGAIQVIVNNLIGFTTNPRELHTSRFSSDLAKRQAFPIFHVNAEDPEAVLRVARMAEAMGNLCIPHISSTGLGFLYMMHFVSAIPNARIQGVPLPAGHSPRAECRDSAGQSPWRPPQ